MVVMIKRIAVGDVMTRNFISVSPTSSLFECAKTFVKSQINTLPITIGKKLVGILRTRDILWAITKKANLDLKKTQAIEIAAKKVAVIKPSADIMQAIMKMRALNFRSLPVIAKGEMIGIVTLKDILRIQPDLYKEIGELAEIREEERKLRSANVQWPLEGLCDNCGGFSELLRVYDRLLCSDCREELY
jgi:CBS domain-containing protein